MADAEKRLSNIRPREVSFVDVPANEKDFLVVKNKLGGKDLGVLKKLEVAVHSINFWKSEYPTIQAVKDFLIKQGIDPEVGTYDDRDYEIRFVVNDASLFEGTSLAASMYVPMNKGVDSLIGVVKSLGEMVDVEKKGAKLSSKSLEKIKGAFNSLKSLLEEVEDKVVEKATEVKKSEDAAVETVAPEAAVEVKAEAKVEEKPAEPVVEVKAEATEAAVEKDSEVSKRLEVLEKKFDDKLKEKDEEITVLKRKLEELENSPSEKKGAAVDGTVEVKKSNGNLWNGIL